MKIIKPKLYSEHEIQSQIVEYLKLKGFYVQRINAGLYGMTSGGHRRFIRGADAGTPDIIFGLPFGKLVLLAFIEVKTAKGTLNPNQREFQYKMKKRGVCHLVARSIEDVEIGINTYLEELSKN